MSCSILPSRTRASSGASFSRGARGALNDFTVSMAAVAPCRRKSREAPGVPLQNAQCCAVALRVPTIFRASTSAVRRGCQFKRSCPRRESPPRWIAFLPANARDVAGGRGDVPIGTAHSTPRLRGSIGGRRRAARHTRGRDEFDPATEHTAVRTVDRSSHPRECGASDTSGAASATAGPIPRCTATFLDVGTSRRRSRPHLRV